MRLRTARSEPELKVAYQLAKGFLIEDSRLLAGDMASAMTKTACGSKDFQCCRYKWCRTMSGVSVPITSLLSPGIERQSYQRRSIISPRMLPI